MRRPIFLRFPALPSFRLADNPVFTAAGGIWALLVGMAFLMLGNGLQGSLLGVRAGEENFGATVTGFVMTGYFAGFLIGSQIAPHTIRRVGHLRVFAAAACLASLAILIQSLLVTPLVWGLMRILTGYCMASAYIVAESWLNDRVTNEHRGGLFSVYMVVTFFGMARRSAAAERRPAVESRSIHPLLVADHLGGHSYPAFGHAAADAGKCRKSFGR